MSSTPKINFRCKPEQKETWTSRAQLEGKPLGEWIKDQLDQETAETEFVKHYPALAKVQINNALAHEHSSARNTMTGHRVDCDCFECSRRV